MSVQRIRQNTIPPVANVRIMSRRILTLAVVAESHLGLAETNGVFALGNAIELLELCLVDALHERVRRGARNGGQQLQAMLTRRR